MLWRSGRLACPKIRAQPGTSWRNRYEGGTVQASTCPKMTRVRGRLADLAQSFPRHSIRPRKPDLMTSAKPAARAAPPPLPPALDKTFKIGLVLQGLDEVLELARGILLLFLSPHAIEHLARLLTAHELSEDPHDLIARYLLHTTAHLSHGTTIFGAI